MELEELRKLIRSRYYETDVKSGRLFLLTVLFEEVGELAEAVRKGEKENVEEELVDVLFMILSIANLFDVSIEKRLVEKYVKSDPSSRWDLL
jgi:NTP pyrophosphatase (non-canonical NTP hydrolase)